MKALFDSLVRTVVPYLVGLTISWLTTTGLDLDSEFKSNLTAVLTATFGTLYFAVVRLLETYVAPKFGWLLGLAKAPVYVKTQETLVNTDVVVTSAPAASSGAGEVVVQKVTEPMDVQAVATASAVAATEPVVAPRNAD